MAVNTGRQRGETLEELLSPWLKSSPDDLLCDVEVKTRTLPQIVSAAVPGEERFDLRRALCRILGRRTAVQEGRNGVQLFARAVLRQITDHCNADVNGLSAEERGVVVGELVSQAARQLVFAAEALFAIGQTCCDANRAKDEKDVPALAQARATKVVLETKFTEEMMNVLRAIVGEENVQ